MAREGGPPHERCRPRPERGTAESACSYGLVCHAAPWHPRRGIRAAGGAPTPRSTTSAMELARQVGRRCLRGEAWTSSATPLRSRARRGETATPYLAGAGAPIQAIEWGEKRGR